MACVVFPMNPHWAQWRMHERLPIALKNGVTRGAMKGEIVTPHRAHPTMMRISCETTGRRLVSQNDCRP